MWEGYVQAGKQAGMKAGKQAGMKAGKLASRQSSKHASKHASRQESKLASRQGQTSTKKAFSRSHALEWLVCIVMSVTDISVCQQI